MIRLYVRGARIACILYLLVLPAISRASEPGFGKVSDGDQLRGCGITIGYSDGTRYVLTANHCLRGDIRFGGYPASVLAKDATEDIALLAVKMPAPVSHPRVAPEGVNAGNGTRYGYPNHKYAEDACGIREDGSLTVEAIPGASGGSIISGGQVYGIITHTTRGVPASKIRSFLATNGYAWLYREAVIRKPPVRDDFDADLEELRRLTDELRRLAEDERRMFERHMERLDRMYPKR